MPDMLSFGEVQISGPRLAEWDEITGPWYYPVHINSSWDDAQISWESLNYSQFKEQTLYEDPLNVSLIEINRENEYVVISGDISIVQTGDSLFFTRNESDLIYENVAISSVSIVSSTTLDILFSTAVTINNYSKLCITTNPIFSSILPSVDFYRYVDSISQINATTIRVKGSMMDINAINSTPLSKYMSCGLFSGTYAIEVLSKIVTGNNTQFNLYDVNKELYYIDGNFAVANADYDVDYAEGRIGINSLTYENANEAEWEEMNTSTWFGLDYHESVSCGFTIPFVTPGGSIRIDEYPSFQFSGNNLISNTKSGLNLAAVELQNSTNEGIQKYDYSVLPAIELYLTGLTGSNIKGSCMAGSTSCVLSEQPSEYPVAVWTGKEWLEIDDISSGTNLVFKTATNYSINNFYLLIPYNYHKQLINSTELQQFYYFIHAKAKNLSSEMLSYVSFANGVESEWISHPKRTYSYPLRNSILFGSTRGEDYLYDKWLYEGGDYPPLNVNIDYISDLHSVQSRVPFMSTLQSPYSFIDTIISTNQQTVPKFTPVMFNYDVSKIPGKSSPKWTVINEESGIIQVISTSINFMWNFTKTGNYTVKLELQDKNGNKSSTTKTSFIVVNKPQPMNLPLSRNMITPTAQTVSTTPSINMI